MSASSKRYPGILQASWQLGILPPGSYPKQLQRWLVDVAAASTGSLVHAQRRPWQAGTITSQWPQPRCWQSVLFNPIVEVGMIFCHLRNQFQRYFKISTTFVNISTFKDSWIITSTSARFLEIFEKRRVKQAPLQIQIWLLIDYIREQAYHIMDSACLVRYKVQHMYHHQMHVCAC